MIDVETALIIYLQAQADQSAHVLADLEAGTPHCVSAQLALPNRLNR